MHRGIVTLEQLWPLVSVPRKIIIQKKMLYCCVLLTLEEPNHSLFFVNNWISVLRLDSGEVMEKHTCLSKI